jgi:hypothetical protein
LLSTTSCTSALDKNFEAMRKKYNEKIDDPDLKMKNGDHEKFAYIDGITYNNSFNPKRAPSKNPEDFMLGLLWGMNDYANNKSPIMSYGKMYSLAQYGVSKYKYDTRKKYRKENKERIVKETVEFMNKVKEDPDVKEFKNGIYYKIVSTSPWPIFSSKPIISDKVKVKYEIRDIYGYIDTVYKLENAKPEVIPILSYDKYIWAQVLQRCPVGSFVTIYIPVNYMYEESDYEYSYYSLLHIGSIAVINVELASISWW